MSVRVETVALGLEYCAVFRSVGKADELMVDDQGKPRRFATASEALRQGRKVLAIETRAAATSVEADPFGIRAWRSQKAEQHKAEREKVFGADGPASLERNGRTIQVERRRRR